MRFAPSYSPQLPHLQDQGRRVRSSEKSATLCSMSPSHVLSFFKGQLDLQLHARSILLFWGKILHQCSGSHSWHTILSPIQPLYKAAIIIFQLMPLRSLLSLKSFNDSLYGDRGKMKCKDLIIELVYLSSLIFCMPILELLPPIIMYYIKFSGTQPVPHSFNSWFICSCQCSVLGQFLLFPQDSSSLPNPTWLD